MPSHKGGLLFFMENLGSFGSSIGMTPALQEAIARRGNTGGATNAVSQSAPGFNPNLQPSGPISSPSPGVPATSPQSQGLPIGSGEAELIVKALSNRLSALSKKEGV